MEDAHLFVNQDGCSYRESGYVIVPDGTTRESVLDLLGCFVDIKSPAGWVTVDADRSNPQGMVKEIRLCYPGSSDDVVMQDTHLGKLCYLQRHRDITRSVCRRDNRCENCVAEYIISVCERTEIKMIAGKKFLTAHSNVLISNDGFIVCKDKGVYVTHDYTHFGGLVWYRVTKRKDQVVVIMMNAIIIVYPCTGGGSVIIPHDLPSPVQEYEHVGYASMTRLTRRHVLVRVICDGKLYGYHHGTGVELLSDCPVISASGMVRVRGSLHQQRRVKRANG